MRNDELNPQPDGDVAYQRARSKFWLGCAAVGASVIAVLSVGVSVLHKFPPETFDALVDTGAVALATVGVIIGNVLLRQSRREEVDLYELPPHITDDIL